MASRGAGATRGGTVMVPLKFAGGAAATLAGSLLFLAAPAVAQPEPGSPAPPYSSRGPVAAGSLSGYTGQAQFATPVPPQGYVGSYRYAYSPTVFGTYSP